MPPTEPVSGPRPARPPADWLRTPGLGGFHASVGFSVDPEATGNGACVVRGTVEERHLNINRVVHGGVYATILDTAMGGSVVTLLKKEEVTATTSLYIEFLRPAELGETLWAKGEVVRRGRHLAFVEGNLFDRSGRRLSQAHGTWYIWSAGDGTWQKKPGGPSARPTKVK
ncbi:MAG: PaaI family thioesterase [Thermoplasmata archaeon]